MTKSVSKSSLITIQNCNDDMTACTFCIRNEDHTLGNVIRHTLIQNINTVDFAGYSVPHPSEPIVQIRIQTKQQQVLPQQQHRQPIKIESITTNSQNCTITTAPQALQESCSTVSKQCDFILNKLEQLIPYVKEDRIQMEQYYLEEDEEEIGDVKEEVDEEEQGIHYDDDDDDKGNVVDEYDDDAEDVIMED
jgi:DNA-directed RNA polymerases I and III subunit RPAC2